MSKWVRDMYPEFHMPLKFIRKSLICNQGCCNMGVPPVEQRDVHGNRYGSGAIRTCPSTLPDVSVDDYGDDYG